METTFYIVMALITIGTITIITKGLGSTKQSNMRCPHKYKKECKELNTLNLSKIPCNKCDWYNNGMVESRGYEILEYIINAFKRMRNPFKFARFLKEQNNSIYEEKARRIEESGVGMFM